MSERLVHRVEDAGELGAHVRRVQAAELGERLGQRHHLLRRRGERARVLQPRAQPERAERRAPRAARRASRRSRRRGGAVERVHVVVAQRRVADQRRHVHGGPRASDRVHVGAECRIRERVGAAEQRERHGERVVAQPRRRRADPAVADDDRRDPLRELGPHLGRAHDVRVVVGMDVDEARGEAQPRSVDLQLGGEPELGADSDDHSVRDRDVCNEWCAACAVDHTRVADECLTSRHRGRKGTDRVTACQLAVERTSRMSTDAGRGARSSFP